MSRIPIQNNPPIPIRGRRPLMRPIRIGTNNFILKGSRSRQQTFVFLGNPLEEFFFGKVRWFTVCDAPDAAFVDCADDGPVSRVDDHVCYAVAVLDEIVFYVCGHEAEVLSHGLDKIHHGLVSSGHWGNQAKEGRQNEDEFREVPSMYGLRRGYKEIF